jgi:hypothetical protein
VGFVATALKADDAFEQRMAKEKALASKVAAEKANKRQKTVD